MEKIHILHSRRILFRNFTEEDKNQDLDIFRNKNINCFIGQEIKDKNELIDKLISSNKNGELFIWHLVKIGENKSLGMAIVKIKEKIATIKILISDKVKNRGYGTEAMESLIHEIFTEAWASRIEVKSKKENGPWIEVIKKAHFEKFKEDKTFSYYKITNLDYMKYFAIYGEIDI
ncbi:MAG: GNAT family N-acetyltransferase [Peptoniphilaceae bacterium]|nr:GNAT family N-acetyltransferase [Peptoniphilaceae bacterium]MDY6018393.1 GNAT family N-acetyltransferase [Anaerococcus sp.]